MGKSFILSSSINVKSTLRLAMIMMVVSILGRISEGEAQSPTTSPTGVEPVVQNADWTPVEQDFDGVTMVLVPAGCFMMGSTETEVEAWIAEWGEDYREYIEAASLQHEQCFDAPFWIDKYEVTQAQFIQFDGEKVSDNFFSGDNLPIETITWYEARDFCEKREGRLPTEREWEYTARGPDDLIYPWGNEWNADNAVWSDNSNSQTAEVGSLPAGVSWVGAMDMSGNVWEWVSTIYGIYNAVGSEFTTLYEYPYQVDDGRETINDDNANVRVIHGGSWYGDASYLRAALRDGFSPPIKYSDIGFRCARDY